MKALFDTSVLVAALLQHHPQHPQAFPRLLAANRGKLQGFLTTHGVAELFATLTALPLRPRLVPADVERLIHDSVLAHLTVVSLTPRHYAEAVSLTVRQGLSSGAVYDALLLVGACSSGCEQLLTFNSRHFRALAPGDPIVVQP